MKSGLRKYSYPLGIVVVYLLFGMLWISFSDRILFMLSEGPLELTRFQTYKGWAFVGVTTCLLSLLLYRYANRMNDIIAEKSLVEEQLDLAIRSADMGLFDTDLISRTTYYSQNWKKQLGYSNDEVGNSFEEWRNRVHPDDLPGALSLIERCLADPETRFRAEFRLRHKDGTYRSILGTAFVKTDRHGDPVRVVGLHQDISDLKAAERKQAESEARFRAMVEYMPVGIFLLNPDGNLEYCNKATEVLTGRPAEDILGMNWVNTIARDDRRRVLDQWKKTITEKKPTILETKIVRPDDSVSWCQISTAPAIAQGRLVGHVGMIFDLNRIAEELKESNEQLLELARLKSLFIASVSHELREPLNSIIGFSSILLKAMDGPINEAQEAHVNSIHLSGKHLLTLINDIVDVSQIESGGMVPHYEEFHLREVVDEVVDISRESIVQKGLGLQVDVPEIVMQSDRQRLAQCLLNLVSNAVKYTKTGSITIGAKETEGQDGTGQVEIMVEDTGIGIAEEDIGDIFSAFTRIHSSYEDKVSGTGLGLYLVRKLTKGILDGSIDVESAPGEGSLFRLVLPRRCSHHTANPVDLLAGDHQVKKPSRQIDEKAER